MIRSVIQAGFGNQLFQYATAYSLAKELNQQLQLDLSFYEDTINTNASNRKESNLLKLRIDTSEYYSKPNGFKKYRYVTRLIFLRNGRIEKNRVPIICEDVARCREYQGELFKRIKGTGAILYGFWQNTRYFNKYINELRAQFRPNYKFDESVEKVLEQVNMSMSVGVHIRRGDFVNLGWDKGSTYYDKGINLLRQRIPGAVFFVVTDDVEWAKSQYGSERDVVIVDVHTGTKDIDEFFILSSCKHQLISESTFGWWAAYLNTNDEKIVVAPSDAKGELFDRDWIKI